MKIKLITTLAALAIGIMATHALALPYNTQTEFSVNGINVPTTGIDATTGLGTRTFTFNTAGNYDVRAFIDLDLSLFITGFSNEYGETFNLPKSGQSWEIDEPGYFVGDLYSNFIGSGFDNTIGTNGYTTIQQPDDVAVGMGWDFNLQAGYNATLSFTVSDTAPISSLFYIGQFESFGLNDPVYFISDLLINPIGTPSEVPEPSTFALVGSALAGLGFYARRRRNR